MCVISESGSNYTFILTNTYSRSTFAVQISKDLFDKAMETRAIWNGEPYIIEPPKGNSESMTS